MPKSIIICKVLLMRKIFIKLIIADYFIFYISDFVKSHTDFVIL